MTALTVAALTDTKPSGWALDIYVSDELYADIIASEPATGIEIALTDPAMNAQVETALRRALQARSMLSPTANLGRISCGRCPPACICCWGTSLQRCSCSSC